VALVTGANHGIGAAVGRALAADGAAVFLTYLRFHPDDPGGQGHPEAYGRLRADTADAVLAEIRAAGGTAEALEVDLSDRSAAPRIFDRAEAALGPVEILVNNASGWLADTFKPTATDRFGRTLRPVDADGFDRQFAVDARAAALLIAEFARRHVARGAGWGRIIGLTSGGPRGFPEEVSYGAAKAAQENYTMAAAQELREFGITANMVHPPPTDTGWVTPEVAAAVERVAQPEDVADLIVLLASDRGRFLTGQLLQMS
jgi:3-oxoacyl-[acyl-carrier protein] reductase